MFSVADAKAEITGILQGINLNNVSNVNGAIERSARTTCQQADIPEASGVYPFLMYGDVYDYPAPSTIFATSVTDLRPQGISRNSNNFAYKVPPETFDRTKPIIGLGNRVSFDFKNGVPIMRATSPWPKASVVLDPMNAIGTSPNQWVAAGTASGLAVDSTNFYQTPASLRFTVTGLGTGTLTKTLPNTVDLTTYQGVGVAFLAIQIPQGATATDLATMALKLGSDSANYSLVTAATGFLGAWVAGDWILVAFDFAGASNAGTPNWAAIDYMQVQVGTLATLTNFRVGYLQIGLPSPMELLFQSAAIFLASGSSTPTKTIFLDTDSVIINDAAYNIFVHESAKAIYLQSGGSLADPMMETLDTLLHDEERGLYPKYRADSPSQELRMVESYYEERW